MLNGVLKIVLMGAVFCLSSCVYYSKPVSHEYSVGPGGQSWVEQSEIIHIKLATIFNWEDGRPLAEKQVKDAVSNAFNQQGQRVVWIDEENEEVDQYLEVLLLVDNGAQKESRVSDMLSMVSAGFTGLTMGIAPYKGENQTVVVKFNEYEGGEIKTTDVYVSAVSYWVSFALVFLLNEADYGQDLAKIASKAVMDYSGKASQ